MLVKVLLIKVSRPSFDKYNCVQPASLFSTFSSMDIFIRERFERLKLMFEATMIGFSWPIGFTSSVYVQIVFEINIQMKWIEISGRDICLANLQSFEYLKWRWLMVKELVTVPPMCLLRSRVTVHRKVSLRKKFHEVFEMC